MLVSPVNISEGRAIGPIAAAAVDALLDLHTDEHHHRAVLTLAGEDAVRAVATAAVARLDLRSHAGVHPRHGVVDVVPFVPFEDSTMEDALAARDRFVEWMEGELGVPCARYGEGERPLPEVRRSLAGAGGHPTAGFTCVGARTPLVAYNVWLAEADLDLARRVASAVRSPAIRALGLAVGDRAQVSMNLVAPFDVGPATAFDAVAAQAPVAGAELVGLVPQGVLDAVPPDRWSELDLGPERTVEERLRRWRRRPGGRSPEPA